jgi:hypothetical protein
MIYHLMSSWRCEATFYFFFCGWSNSLSIVCSAYSLYQSIQGGTTFSLVSLFNWALFCVINIMTRGLPYRFLIASWLLVWKRGAFSSLRSFVIMQLVLVIVFVFVFLLLLSVPLSFWSVCHSPAFCKSYPNLMCSFF